MLWWNLDAGCKFNENYKCGQCYDETWINHKKMGESNEDITHRTKIGWLKLRSVFHVLCDSKISLKLKGKFYNSYKS